MREHDLHTIHIVSRKGPFRSPPVLLSFVIPTVRHRHPQRRRRRFTDQSHHRPPRAGHVLQGQPAAERLRPNPREIEIRQLLVQGHSTKEAAAQLSISYHTADGYIRAVYEKLQVNTRSGAVAKAVKEGLV